MKTMLILLALTLSGCGMHRDQAFEPIVQEFEADWHAHGGHGRYVTTQIEFGDVTKVEASNDAVAVCVMGLLDGDAPRIVVDAKAWNAMHPLTRKSVLYHELGHCELLRGHKSDVDQYNRPTSYMHPMVIDAVMFMTYQGYEKELTDELFESR